MAYNAVVTVTPKGADKFIVDIVETDVGTGDTCNIDGLPIAGTLVRAEITLNSGDAEGIAPKLTTSTRTVAQVSQYDASHDIAAAVPYYDDTTTSGAARLVHQSRPNAGSNNAVTTRYYFKTDW
jgi:hypothetical protein